MAQPSPDAPPAEPTVAPPARPPAAGSRAAGRGTRSDQPGSDPDRAVHPGPAGPTPRRAADSCGPPHRSHRSHQPPIGPRRSCPAAAATRAGSAADRRPRRPHPARSNDGPAATPCARTPRRAPPAHAARPDSRASVPRLPAQPEARPHRRTRPRGGRRRRGLAVTAGPEPRTPAPSRPRPRPGSRLQPRRRHGRPRPRRRTSRAAPHLRRRPAPQLRPQQLAELADVARRPSRSRPATGAGTARIVLSPPELGHVQIRLHYGDGGVTRLGRRRPSGGRACTRPDHRRAPAGARGPGPHGPRARRRRTPAPTPIAARSATPPAAQPAPDAGADDPDDEAGEVSIDPSTLPLAGQPGRRARLNGTRPRTRRQPMSGTTPSATPPRAAHDERRESGGRAARQGRLPEAARRAAAAPGSDEPDGHQPVHGPARAVLVARADDEHGQGRRSLARTASVTQGVDADRPRT